MTNKEINDLYFKCVDVWRSWNIRTEEDLDARLENFRVEFAYNSGKIEDPLVNLHDTVTVFGNGRQVFTSTDGRALFETKNQRECYYYIMPYVIMRAPITLEFIKQIHYELMRGCYDSSRWAAGERPGTFKKNPVYIGLHVETTPPELVESELNQLLAIISNANDSNAAFVAATFHGVFEGIHPFSDGNGRTGRTLMNYFLMTHDMPPTVIYDEDKIDYFQFLEIGQSKSDYGDLKRFVQLQTIKTWGISMGVTKGRPVNPLHNLKLSE